MDIDVDTDTSAPAEIESAVEASGENDTQDCLEEQAGINEVQGEE